jgi:hypothetical protein
MRINAIWLAIVIVLVTATGCSSRLAYNNLDWLAVRWVDRQVSLDRDQRQLVSDHVDALQRWHCATQMSDYQNWLEQVRLDLLRDDIKRDTLIEYGQQLAVFANRLAKQSKPMLVDFATSVNSQQVDAILQELDERIDKLSDEVDSRSAEQWAIDRVEGMERRLRRLMGPLNPRQHERLERWAQDLVATHRYQLMQRQYWRDRIAQALERRSERGFLSAEIKALLTPADVWPDNYRQAIETNRELTLDALHDLVGLIEPRQRNRISARLSRLKNDFERLGCSGELPPDSPSALLAEARSG